MPQLMRPWGAMHYEDHGGAGAAFLMLPGTSCDSTDWGPCLRLLSARVRPVCMDFPGHGRSAVPRGPLSLEGLSADALALAEHLRLRHVGIVGHSLGGIAALHAAALSDVPDCLVLLEGWTRLDSDQAFAAGHLYGGLGPEAVREIQRKDAETVSRIDPRVWRGLSESVGCFDAWPYLQRAKIPILEVYGDCGRTADAERLLAIPDNPRIATVWVPGAGHYLPHERPREVAEIINAAAERL